jgi:uncharacterized damage-inducible protein DinB
MTELERIVDQLKRSWGGNAWHGPSLSEILAGVEPETAAARPIPTAHSIWELVLHITTWDRVVARRLREWVKITVSEEENFPLPGETTAERWRAAVEELRRTHEDLETAVLAFREDRLNEIVPGKTTSAYVMMQGVVQHELYHGGQIALLKKA